MLWPSPSYDYQMNGIDICLSYMNLQDILDGKWTACYKSISDILISMFSGIIQTFAGVTSGSDPRVTRNADMRRTSEAEPDG